MSNALTQDLYYVLPLPLSQPSVMSRLAGLSLMRINSAVGSCDLASQKKLLLCKAAPHALLSPIYLFSQHIDPHNLKHGDNALKFVTQALESLRPKSDQDVLVAFSLKQLSVLNAMCIQNFFTPCVYQRFNYILELKTALQAAHYFGNTKLKNLKSARNLNKAAAELGFDSASLDNQLRRTEAMHYIFNVLMQRDVRLMSFLLKSNAERYALVKKYPYLVTIDDDSGAIEVLKVLVQSADGRLVKVLKTDSKSVELKVLNLDFAPLLAPSSIMTPERLSELKFDLNYAISLLEQANLNDLVEDRSELSSFSLEDLPFYDSYWAKLNPKEQEIFRHLSSHDIRKQPSLEELMHLQTKFAKQILCYLNENFPAAVFDGQRHQYEQYVHSLHQGRIATMVQEYKILEQNLSDKDVKGAQLLARIASYF